MHTAKNKMLFFCVSTRNSFDVCVHKTPLRPAQVYWLGLVSTGYHVQVQQPDTRCLLKDLKSHKCAGIWWCVHSQWMAFLRSQLSPSSATYWSTLHHTEESVAYQGVQTPPPRNSEGPPKLCQTQPDLRKLLKIAEFRMPTPPRCSERRK